MPDNDPVGTVTAEVAVVGGGLVGISIGYGLARLGVDTVVVDEGDAAFRAARGNFALVWTSSKGVNMPAYHRWSRRSADTYAELGRELAELTDIDIGLEQRGGLVFCLTEEDMAKRRKAFGTLASRLGENEYPFEFLDNSGLAKLVPDVGPEVIGGVYSPLDGHVNSLRLFHALHRGFRAHGGRYLPGASVERIDTTGGDFTVVAGERKVRAGKLVLTAGIDNGRLAPFVGLTAPVRPQRGQMIVTERTAPFLPYPTVTIRQTDDGSVMIGDSKEEAVLDTDVGLGILGVEADRAVRALPRIAGLNVVRMWSALRVMTPDAAPVYDCSQSGPKAFAFTCHSGVTLTASHVFDLASMVARGDLDESMKPFSCRRFDVPASG